MENINNKTIIEKITYMDIDDPKNNWYLDAEEFDVNFPLGYTNRPLDVCQKNCKDINVTLSCHYDHFYSLAEYFSQSSVFSALIIEVSFPNKFITRDEIMHSPKDMGLVAYDEAGSGVLNRIFEFGIEDKLKFNDGESVSVYRYILVAPVPDLLALKSRFVLRNYGHIVKKGEDPVLDEFYKKGRQYLDALGSTDCLPFSQLIVTKDWDLVKRYLFFMIRNHQYANAFLRYSRDNRLYPNNRIPEFIMDVTLNNELIAGFQQVPKDYRFGKLDQSLVYTDETLINRDTYELCRFNIGLIEVLKGRMDYPSVDDDLD